LAKDPKTDSRARGTSGASSGRSAGGGARPGGKGGRTRPPTQVVTAQRKPWGLIAGAVAVVVFAAAVITYATVQVNKANEGRITSTDQIAGLQTFDYAAGQQHVTTPVTYTESPPVGGPHDGEWADCTGTVYDVDIRHENAVHSLEHGAVWITYDPARVTGDAVTRLAALVDGEYGRMLSPYAGLDSPISLQSWNHQLKVESVDDPRIKQFADFLTQNADVEGHYPEVGASCENPQFISSPLTVDAPSRGSNAMATDAPTTPSAGGSSTP
jgi:hypothetical protein